MHLQATVEYDKFARALSIGAETMVMDFRPDEPMHNRYAVSHDFLSPSAGHQAVAISRIVNAFFGWEFNSCEMLVAGDSVHPIDYANACPDVAITSLHYYFPWAISALVKWSVFSLATGRRTKVDLHTERYFAIADDDSLDYDAKIEALPRPGRRALRDCAYHEWCAENLPDFDDRVRDWFSGSEFSDDPARDGRGDVPGRRAGEVPGALPGPDQPVAGRPGGALVCETTTYRRGGAGWGWTVWSTSMCIFCPTR